MLDSYQTQLTHCPMVTSKTVCRATVVGSRSGPLRRSDLSQHELSAKPTLLRMETRATAPLYTYTYTYLAPIWSCVGQRHPPQSNSPSWFPLSRFTNNETHADSPLYTYLAPSWFSLVRCHSPKSTRSGWFPSTRSRSHSGRRWPTKKSEYER